LFHCWGKEKYAKFCNSKFDYSKVVTWSKFDYYYFSLTCTGSKRFSQDGYFMSFTASFAA
jgi:hypothetical protein